MTNTPISATQIVLPVSLLSFILVIFFGFQTSLLIADRDSLDQARTQQDTLLEQVGKVKAQANTLAVGTLRLAQQGNKDAQNIIEQLKKSGVDIQDQPAAPNAAPAAAAPAPMAPVAPEVAPAQKP